MNKIISVLLAGALFAPFVAAASSTVVAIGGAGVSVTPSGTVVVPTGVTQTFSPFTSTGYVLSSVSLDGVAQALGSVDFTGLAIDPVTHDLTFGATASIVGGGTMPFCSGPMAPGWNVSLPGGGCGGTATYIPKTTGTSSICPDWFPNGCVIQ